MSKFLPEKIENFRIFYVELRKNKLKTQFRDEICKATGWAYSTFYHKMKYGNVYRDEAPIVKSIIETFGRNENIQANKKAWVLYPWGVASCSAEAGRLLTTCYRV